MLAQMINMFLLSQVEEAKRRKRSHSVGQRESIGVHTRSQSLQVVLICTLFIIFGGNLL